MPDDATPFCCTQGVRDMKIRNQLFGIAGLSLAATLAAVAWAQSGEAPATDAPAADAPAAPPVAIKARDAEMMPKASKSLMLSVVDTGEHYIAVGDRGEILASNNGLDWAQVPVPVRAPLTAVTFVDPKNGWAVGHDAVIVHTTDGGKTWAMQNFQPELQKPFLGVTFLDAMHGFAVGAYGLFDETSDGGTTWNEVKADDIRGDELNLYSITKLANGDLFIAGEQGRIGLSVDHGKTWKKLALPYEGTLFGAVPVGDKGVLVCGLRGHAYISKAPATGGWQALDTKTTNSFYGCSRLNDKEIGLFGLNGIVLKVDPGSGAVTPVPNSLDAAISAGVVTKSGLVIAGEKGMLPVVELH